MGRLERKIKAKIRATRQDFGEWYTSHGGIVDEEGKTVPSGNSVAKLRIVQAVCSVVAVILVALIATVWVACQYNSFRFVDGLTFSDVKQYDEELTDEQIINKIVTDIIVPSK